MSYRLACADFTFPLLSHQHALQLIAMLGLDGVDIGLFEGRSHLWPSREFEDAEGSGRRLRVQLDGLGLRVADVFLQVAENFVPYAINHPQKERRAHARNWFLHTLDYAAAAGAAHVTTLPGVAFEAEPAEDSLARAVDELHWRVEEARKRDIVFSVEAHVGSIAPDPDCAKALVENVTGLSLTLDYTHFTRGGLPDAAVEPLIQHASHFHARGAREGRLQTTVRDNTIDYGRVLECMKDTGYDGWIGIEYVWTEWERCNECDNLSETILLRNFFRASDQA